MSMTIYVASFRLAKHENTPTCYFDPLMVFNMYINVGFFL